MKLIGFIKEHNGLSEAQEYSLIKEYKSGNQYILGKVIDYLNSGILVLSWMGYFLDLEDSSLISPDSYFTDGVYVWPAYFPYYLKKFPNYLLDDLFLSHIYNNNYLIDQTKLDESLIAKLENDLAEKLNGSCNH